MTRDGPRRRHDPDAMNQRLTTLGPASSCRTCPQSSTTPRGAGRVPPEPRRSRLQHIHHRDDRGRGVRSRPQAEPLVPARPAPRQPGGGHPQAPARPGLRSRGHTADPRSLRRSQLRWWASGTAGSLTDVLLQTLVASDRFGRAKNPAQGPLSDQLLPTLVAGDGSHGPGHRPDRAVQNRLTARLLERPTLNLTGFEGVISLRSACVVVCRPVVEAFTAVTTPEYGCVMAFDERAPTRRGLYVPGDRARDCVLGGSSH